MTGERTYPVLPCGDLDEALTFYRALGFTVSFRQLRPNPYAVVELDDIGIHLAGIEGFDPAQSYGSAIITVPEPEALHATFAAGLREQFGTVPTIGIPRLLRPRRKAGTATGFSVVDAGGNWLRFFRTQGAGETEEDEQRSGLGRVIDVAARQGDAHGDEARAIAVLDAGMTRHPEETPSVMLEALLYRAELTARIGESPDPDLEAAARLIATHDLGPEAEQSLATTREATGS